MPHPAHPHGHAFQVVAIDRDRFAGALRDTVLVPSNATVTVAFDGDIRDGGRFIATFWTIGTRACLQLCATTERAARAVPA